MTKQIRFDGDYIYLIDESGSERRQSLLWYDRLRRATPEERAQYTLSAVGIHWRNLDEDISFESFSYDDAEPTPLQRFFLMHKEINIAEFAKRAGINAALLRNYINGFKKPSRRREREIMAQVGALGQEFVAAAHGRVPSKYRPTSESVHTALPLTAGDVPTVGLSAASDAVEAYGKAARTVEASAVAALIAAALRRKGMTQKELAARAGIASSRVSAFVAARALPTLPVAGTLCRILGIPPAAMLGGHDSETALSE